MIVSQIKQIDGNEIKISYESNDPLESLQVMNLMESKDSRSDANPIPTMFDDLEFDQNIFETPSKLTLK